MPYEIAEEDELPKVPEVDEPRLDFNQTVVRLAKVMERIEEDGNSEMDMLTCRYDLTERSNFVEEEALVR
jgi:hypothetical protein